MSYLNPLASVQSSGNSTTSALNNGATFTGTGELTNHNDVLITCETDQSGVLYADFSPDGTNWDSTLTFTVTANIYEIHRLVKGYRYFRVRFTNDSGSNQTFLRLHTSYGTFGPLTSPRNLAMAADADTLVSRPTDFNLELARGIISDESFVGKFGQNGAVGTSEEDIWAQGGTYNWLETADTVRVAAGGNAADDASAGVGARTVTIIGLDSNWDSAEETVTLAGASASASTSTSFIRVFRAYVATAGTYHGSNTGAITIETTGGTTVAYIEAGVGQTQLALYTIPDGQTGYLTRFWTDIEGNKTVTVKIWQLQNADDTSAPVTGKRIIRNFPGLAGSVNKEFGQYVELPARTDIWVSGQTASGTSGIAAGFDIILQAV